MRHYLIDGHNIIFKDSGLKSVFSTDAGRALNELIMRCSRIVAGKNKKCSIYFDGSPPADIIRPSKGIQVTFSYDRSADELIKSGIARSRNPRNLIIVSDDTEIRDNARAHECEIMTARDFINLSPGPKSYEDNEKPSMDNLSIKEWLRLFNK